VPIVVLAADDGQPDDAKKSATATVTVETQADAAEGDQQKQEKRVEVRVLQLDGKDGGKPQIKILRSEDGGKPVELKVIGIDRADTPVKVFVDGQVASEKAEKRPYLGVMVEPVPPALTAHLPGLVSKEQGLIVTNVGGDSPAEKAGLKQHDILVTYDDQKLFSFEQLTKLVRGDKAGREVSLGVVRAGKLETVKATLAEREVPAGVQFFGGDPERAIRLWDLDAPRLRGEVRKELEDRARSRLGGRAGADVRSQFLSMKLESLDDDRFKAEIEFKNEKGDRLKQSFEGTRDEIRKQIEQDKEIPETMRGQLMRSLEMGKGGRPGAFRFFGPGGAAAFGFSFDADKLGAFTFPDGKNFDQIIEAFSDDIDPRVREQLRKAFRSIEESRPKPTPTPRGNAL
jgi:hypothetical protein